MKGKEAAIAAMGGHFSAVADREHVTYSATVVKADVAKAMEILAAAVKVRVMGVGEGTGSDSRRTRGWVSHSLFPRKNSLITERRQRDGVVALKALCGCMPESQS